MLSRQGDQYQPLPASFRRTGQPRRCRGDWIGGQGKEMRPGCQASGRDFTRPSPVAV